MARHRNVTREEIFAAASEIAEQEEGNVTLEAVRQKVGGSFTTLGPALREWRTRQAEAEAVAPPPGEDLPEPLRQQLEELGRAFWSAVQKQAAARLEADRKQLQRERAEMEAARTEVAKTADDLAKELDQLRTRCAALEEEIQSQQGDLAEAREAKARAEARASTQQILADELREQLAATRQSLCADLLARVEALESDR